jgi:hypothetical protein
MTASFGLVTITVFRRGGRWCWSRCRRARFGDEGETAFSPSGWDSETECWREEYRAAG